MVQWWGARVICIRPRFKFHCLHCTQKKYIKKKHVRLLDKVSENNLWYMISIICFQLILLALQHSLWKLNVRVQTIWFVYLLVPEQLIHKHLHDKCICYYYYFNEKICWYQSLFTRQVQRSTRQKQQSKRCCIKAEHSKEKPYTSYIKTPIKTPLNQWLPPKSIKTNHQIKSQH